MSRDYYKKAQVDRLMARHTRKNRMSRVAGEIRHFKDRSDGVSSWAWEGHPPTARDQIAGFEYDPDNIKPLATTLKYALAAKGFSEAAFTSFIKTLSSTISPDGNLGGRGYIQKISDIRRALLNTVEALAAISDTLYDELHAPHWQEGYSQQDPQEQEEIRDALDDAQEIREDSQDWVKRVDRYKSRDDDGPITPARYNDRDGEDERFIEDVPEEKKSMSKQAALRVIKKYNRRRGY